MAGSPTAGEAASGVLNKGVNPPPQVALGPLVPSTLRKTLGGNAPAGAALAAIALFGFQSGAALATVVGLAETAGGSSSILRLHVGIEHALKMRREGTMMRLKTLAIASAIAVSAAIPATAQQPAAPAPPPTTPYGAPITLEAAKKAMAAAEAEAMKNNWPLAIVIVDSGGNLVMLHKLDNTQYGSIRVAEGKARTALDFRRPTKVFEEGLAAGGIGLRILSLGVTAAEGGMPIIVDGKVVGAIGASGALSTQDAQAAKAGADAVK
jgi:uncharacterized protein GlcG (DUF336 family)